MDENKISWLDTLPRKKLFTYLRESNGDLSGTTTADIGNMMCTVRGNLFVWNPKTCEVLTLNMKHAVAHPEDDPEYDIFQVLYAP